MPLPCVGTVTVAAALSGRPRSLPVVADGPHAVYAQDGDDVLAVLTRDATQVPLGLRTPWQRLPDHGGTLAVGGGSVRIGRHELRVGRLVDRRVPHLQGLLTAPRPGPSVVGPLLARVRDLVPGEAVDLLAAGDAAAVPALLGLGPGLTPLGDDVLAGWLVAHRACRLPDGDVHDAVHDAVRDLARTRTTAVSAALLHRALDGEVVPELAAALRALAGHGAHGPALRVLAGVGDTSGAGLLLGALSVPTTPTTTRRPA